MQLFTHLLSSYLQGMGDFFSALAKGGRSNWSPSPTLPKGRESKLGPLPNPPQREGVPPNRLKHSKNGLPPLGEGRGGAFGGLGRGFSQAAVFVPALAGLFLPPTAAFFTMVIAGVMRGMTVVMAVTAQRKTCFPTVGTTGTTKAKPPAVPTAFCVYFIPMWR